MSARVDVSHLSGVPQTLLWPLYNRAAEARRPDTFFRDPLAVQIADSIDYDYARSFGKPDASYPVRAMIFDRALRRWFRQNPGGQVVALGEGLETQFRRVDDGRVHWLSVDLPEAIDLRRRFLPDTDRCRNLACSALDPRWMDEVTPGRPVFVTAAGVLMYFQPGEVRRLIAGIAERFPTAELLFDVIPHWFSRMTQRGLKITPHYQTPPMPWSLNRDELKSMRRWHPNIAGLRVLPYRGGRGFFCALFLSVFGQLPWLGDKMFSIVHLTCRPGPRKSA